MNMRRIGTRIAIFLMSSLCAMDSHAGDSAQQNLDALESIKDRALGYYVPLACRELEPAALERALRQELFFSTAAEMTFATSGPDDKLTPLSIADFGGAVIIRGSDDITVAKAIAPGDIILKVDSENVVGRNAAEVALLFRKRTNPDIEVTFWNPTNARTDSVKLREKYTPIPDASGVIERDGKRFGYVSFLKAQRKDSVIAECRKFAEQNVAGLILDLRDSYRMFPDAVGEISALFVEPGSTLYFRRERKDDSINVERIVAPQGQQKLDIPVVVLLNGGTRAGALLLAVALSDAGHFHSIGEAAKHEGLIRLVASPAELHGGSVSFPIGEYLRADKTPIFPNGIKPTEVLNASRDSLYFLSRDAEKDIPLQAALHAIEDRIKTPK